METIFGVVRGDLYYHDRFDKKILILFIRVCQVTHLDESCQNGIIVESE